MLPVTIPVSPIRTAPTGSEPTATTINPETPEAQDKSETPRAVNVTEKVDNPATDQARQRTAQSGETVELEPAEQRVLDQLRARDRAVRAHEQAHLSAAGSLATGGANFTYQRGPDGQRYAVGGEVGIDGARVPGDPEATIQRAQQIRRAALAPLNPSAQDRSVAANAAATEQRAQAELIQLQQEEREQSVSASYLDAAEASATSSENSDPEEQRPSPIDTFA